LLAQGLIYSLSAQVGRPTIETRQGLSAVTDPFLQENITVRFGPAAQARASSSEPQVIELVGEFIESKKLPAIDAHAVGLRNVSLAIKRAIDIGVAALGLLLLAPLWALIALAVRLDSPGPVLFRQTRVGEGGVEFEMFKFRTMIDGADERRGELAPLSESPGLFKLRNDPRLTQAGRALRRASLDELPQLLNVVRGEMSLVGPRPLVPDEDRLIQGPYRARLQVTPGMTGPWQAIGHPRPRLGEMVVIDCLYAESWSLWADIKIVLRTLGSVVRLRGL
jgi:lipopolysaccharide/colanic/teichoic acid biosynthesis glycosyltransferase